MRTIAPGNPIGPRAPVAPFSPVGPSKPYKEREISHHITITAEHFNSRTDELIIMLHVKTDEKVLFLSNHSIHYQNVTPVRAVYFHQLISSSLYVK